MADDTFRMNPITACAALGAVAAFIAVDAINAVLWVALGAAIGGGIGYGIRLLGQRTREYAGAVEREGELGELTRDQLYRKAKRLGIQGRSKMSHDDLVHEIAERDRAS